MKKIISLVLMIAMLFSLSAFAVEEEFTLHNGTKFNMSPEEVIQLEEQAGFDASELDSTGHISLSGKIAGQEGTNASYWFQDDKLVQMTYTFVDDSSFQAISNALIQKYGVSEYSSDTRVDIPTFEIYGRTYSDNHDIGVYFENQYARLSRVSCSYSQYIIQISDNEYVYIDHTASKVLRENLGMFSSKGNEYSTNHNVEYVLLDAETVEKIFNDLNQLNSDL